MDNNHKNTVADSAAAMRASGLGFFDRAVINNNLRAVAGLATNPAASGA